MRDFCTEIPFMQGPAKYRVDVAGESFYDESFKELCGERTIMGARIEATARLELCDDNPHDNRAVRVTIKGYPVGHLSREDARAFRRLVRYGALAEHEKFECAAIICGGWDRGDGDEGNFGVRLDLALNED
jgi:hypothetical protein